MVEFIGEFFVELFAYGTYGIIDQMMGKLPIHWDKHVRKVTCVIVSILLWLALFYIIIKIL